MARPAAAGDLAATEHRPWPLPSRPWAMAQRWHDLLFAHWPLEPGALETLLAELPPGAEPDLWEGCAWVGVVPFRMSGVRLRGLPALPGLSAFPELNVRTYVRCHGTPGVLFRSLDAASRLAVAGARAWYGLPYFRARMRSRPWGERGEQVVYASERTHRGAPPAALRARYGPTGPASAARPGTLDHWLCERYALFVARRGHWWRADVHHGPWPLQPAAASFELETMAAAAGLRHAAEAPRLAFARRLDVRVWAPRPAEGRG